MSPFSFALENDKEICKRHNLSGMRLDNKSQNINTKVQEGEEEMRQLRLGIPGKTAGTAASH